MHVHRVNHTKAVHKALFSWCTRVVGAFPSQLRFLWTTATQRGDAPAQHILESSSVQHLELVRVLDAESPLDALWWLWNMPSLRSCQLAVSLPAKSVMSD